MTIAPAQIINYTGHDLHGFYNQLSEYDKWENIGYDWHMMSHATPNRLMRHKDLESVTLSMRKKATIKGFIRTSYRIDGKVVAKDALGQMLLDRGAIGSSFWCV